MLPIKFKLVAGDSSPVTSEDTTDHSATTWLASRDDRAWFMTLSTSTRPRCPACGGRMLPKAVSIADDTAWCDLCWLHDHHEDLALLRAIVDRGFPLEVTTSRGIAFWTPPTKIDDQPVLLRWSIIALEQRVPTPDLTLQQVRDLMDDPSITGVETILDIESQRFPHHDPPDTSPLPGATPRI